MLFLLFNILRKVQVICFIFTAQLQLNYNITLHFLSGGGSGGGGDERNMANS